MIEALRREYRSLPPAYWTLWLGTLVNKAGSFVVPFLALYITARGGSELDAGLVLAAYGAGSFLAGLTGGVLADRVGRRATMLLSMFGGAAAMLAMGFARSLAAIAATTFLMGWMAELYRPAVSAAIADLVPARDRARAYARLYWVINLGFALAPTLAGLVASYSYFAIFVVDAITLAGFGLIVLARVRETRPTTAPVLPRSPSGNVTIPGLAVVLRDRTFMGFALLNLGLALVMWQNGAALPLDMRRHGISEATYGVLMAINGVLIIVLQPLMTPLLARLSRTRVLAVAALFFGVGFGLYGLVGTPAGYAVAIAVWTIAEIATLPTSSAVVADLAPAALRGRYQGVYSASWGIASTIGPLVGGGLLFAVGGHALWFGCFGLMLVVTIGHVVLGPARARREAAAHAALAHEHELAQEPARAA